MSTELRTSLDTLRRLAGAVVLQLAPVSRSGLLDPGALDIALALRRAGARSIVAGPVPARIAELQVAGIEWLALAHDSINPFRLRANAKRLEAFISAERVDVIHAYNAGAAWSAMAATEKLAVWLVTSLPESVPPRHSLRGLFQTPLARADHMIAHSSFTAGPLINRFDIPHERVTVVPHPIDAGLFDPATMEPQRVLKLRNAWKVPQGDRIVLVPGPIAPNSGQAILVDAVGSLPAAILDGITFVLIGDPNTHRGYLREVLQRAEKLNIGPRLRLAGNCTDWPAALAAADIVAMPALEPDALGWPLPQSQAMARPVIASAIGILPENMLAPPRMPGELRTGWLYPPGDGPALAQALREALSLDLTSYRALAARARQFAQFMFSPQNVAVSVLSVYSRLLAGPR